MMRIYFTKKGDSLIGSSPLTDGRMLPIFEIEKVDQEREGIDIDLNLLIASLNEIDWRMSRKNGVWWRYPIILLRKLIL